MLPLLMLTPLLSKPVTGSLKCTVTGIGDVLVVFGAVELIVTVGAVVSATTVRGVPNTADTLPATSFAHG
jgi:hypothetical protein